MGQDGEVSDRLEVIPPESNLPPGASPGAPVEPGDIGDSNGRDAKRSIPVLAILQLLCLAVIAAALVVIAFQERERTVITKRNECREAALNYREDFGNFPAGYRAQVEEACGGRNPLEDK